ncbi:MAG TPA: hypothetical protein VK850_08655 [Candidatus Binatia bacterium]|nr:hypothetical protein [Candidatus Binatia bacterium]
MSEQLLDQTRVYRPAFSVTSLAEAEQADLAYWRAGTPDERLEALELSRQIPYGYVPFGVGWTTFFTNILDTNSAVAPECVVEKGLAQG